MAKRESELVHGDGDRGGFHRGGHALGTPMD
jgi:hypothetical protein